eukprot:CAMPEP_0113939800 /NCGR_PEP_ID=MMETSP1339-20121228/6051_1 /TAXON_ID=94617 /ORGANISM="Fibrocapsa japonica" /LENGTH=561 /DNA_ID=CAMNT_0000943415 /DNA_START=305 /DNA_END=1990 /DNA_ORIENTATION=- /assembly_acc=CAM_ASM_000762
MTVLGAYSCHEGDIYKLIYSVDYKGRICGGTIGFTEKKQVYYVRYDGTGVCVDGCPTLTEPDKLYACVDDDDMPSYLVGSKNYDALFNNGYGFCMFKYESKSVLNYCIFKDLTVREKFNTYLHFGYFESGIDDIYRARWSVLVFGFFFSVIVSFSYLVIMRSNQKLIKAQIWTSIVVVELCFLVQGVFYFLLSFDWDAEDPPEHTDNEVLACRVLGFLLWVVSVIWLFWVWFLREKMKLAFGIVREAAFVVKDMSALLMLPMLQIFIFAMFMCIWLMYLLLTASLGQFIEIKDIAWSFTAYEFSNSEVQGRGWFLLFCFFWTTQMILACGQISICMQVCSWYFHEDKKLEGKTFWKNIRKVLYYHFGTAAFASAVLALVQFFRMCISYMHTKTRRDPDSMVSKVLHKCCFCCFYWLDHCLKHFSKHAYVQTALFAHPYFASARTAYYLVDRHLEKIMNVSLVSEFLMMLGKLSLSFTTTFMAYLMFINLENVSGVVAPTLMVLFLSYFVAEVFLEVYGMTIFTILQCYLADMEMFGEDSKYAQHSIRDHMETATDGSIIFH